MRRKLKAKPGPRPNSPEDYRRFAEESVRRCLAIPARRKRSRAVQLIMAKAWSNSRIRPRRGARNIRRRRDRYWMTAVGASSRADLVGCGGAATSAARVTASSAGQKSPVGSCRWAGVFCAARAWKAPGLSGVTHTSPVGMSACRAGGSAAAMSVVAMQAAAAAAIVECREDMEPLRLLDETAHV